MVFVIFDGLLLLNSIIGELGNDWTSGNLNITVERKQLTVFSTSLSLKRESQSGGKSALKPMLLVTRNNQVVLKTQGETNTYDLSLFLSTYE